MTDRNHLPTPTLEERLRALTERVAKLEQERSKGLLGRLFGGRGVAVVLALVLVLGGGGTSYAMFVTGNTYLQKSENGRMGYVEGLYDAFETDENYSWIRICTSDWNNDQLQAVFDKFYADRPEDRAYPAAWMLPLAIGNTCPSAPAKYKQ